MLEDLSLGVSRELIQDRSELLFTVRVVSKTIKPMLGYVPHKMLETSQKQQRRSRWHHQDVSAVSAQLA